MPLGAIEQAEAIVASKPKDPTYTAATQEYVGLRSAQIQSAINSLGGEDLGMGALRSAELDACQLFLQGGDALANATEALRRSVQPQQ